MGTETRKEIELSFLFHSIPLDELLLVILVYKFVQIG